MQASDMTHSVSKNNPPIEKDDLLETILNSLDDHKAEEIITIPLSGKSSIADHMVIANGRSARQVASLADHVVSDIRDTGRGRARIEGLPQADWVLIDAGDVIVHLFRPDVREFYNLEKMWGTDLGLDQGSNTVAH